MSRSEEDDTLDSEDEEERTSSTTANEDIAPMFGSLLSLVDTPPDTRTVLTEDWWHIARKWYPDMLHKVYCVPPVHLYAVSYKERNPRPEFQEPFERFGMRMLLPTQYSNVRDDEAQQRVLSTLLMFLNARDSVAFVLSNVVFQNYLNKDYTLAPGVWDLPRLTQNDEGEIDVIVIDKHCGIFALEVKATGYRHELTTEEKMEDCLAPILKLTKQLPRNAMVLRRILADLDPEEQIKIRTGVMMPNLDKGILRTTFKKHPKALNDFAAAVGAQDIEDAVNCCLCSDGFPPARIDTVNAVEMSAILKNIGHFWNTMEELTEFMNVPIEDGVYEQLVARFCGPLSTVKVYTEKSMPRVELTVIPARKKDPRRRSKNSSRPAKIRVEPFEVRTLAGAAREIATRFSELALLPEQIDLLKSDEDFVHLEGPPGTGKTLILLQRILTSLDRDNLVFLLSLSPVSRSVIRILYEQVKEIVFLHKGRERASEILKSLRLFITTRPEKTLDTKYFERRLHKWRLRAKLKDSEINWGCPRKVCLVLDETGVSGNGLKAFFDQVAVCHREKCFTSVEAEFTAGLSVWSASVEKCGRPCYVRDPKTEPYSEEKFGVYRHLKMPLRCPPSVQRALMLVQPALDKDNVFLFEKDNMQPIPARPDEPYSKHFQYHADGLPVFLIGHGGHEKADKPVWLCRQCGGELASFLKDRLRIGEEPVMSDVPLQETDVLIVGTHGLAFNTSLVKGGFLTAICERGLRLGITTAREEGGASLIGDVGEQAGTINAILVSDLKSVHGLERAVVVAVPEVPPPPAQSPQQQQQVSIKMGEISEVTSARINVMGDKPQIKIKSACSHVPEFEKYEAMHAPEHAADVTKVESECAHATESMEFERASTERKMKVEAGSPGSAEKNGFPEALQAPCLKLRQESGMEVSEEEDADLDSDIDLHEGNIETCSNLSRSTLVTTPSWPETRKSWHTEETLSDSKGSLSDSQQKAFSHGSVLNREHSAHWSGVVPKRQKLDYSSATEVRSEPGTSESHGTGGQYPPDKGREEKRKKEIGPFYTEPPSEREIQAALSTLSEQDQRDLFYIGSRAVCQLVIIHFGK